jgi:hypothetical protein
MRTMFHAGSRLAFCLILLTVATISITPLTAQTGSRTPDTDRLFLGFAKDASLANQQWWEGQLEVINHDSMDVVAANLVFAIRPIERFEFGGKVGFADSDLPTPLNDQEGSGATDLDLWGKYELGSLEDGTDLVVGVTATVPTGDDSAGLGMDSFDIGAFVSSRKTMDRFDLVGHVGANFHGDGRILGVDLDGKVSAELGIGFIFPMSETLSLVAEGNIETDQYKNAGTLGDTDTRILGGLDWKLADHGMFRGALALGLTDGAPDTQLILGYAARF